TPAESTPRILHSFPTRRSSDLVTVSMTSTAGTVTGNVSLSVDGGTAASKALSSGSATFSNTDIPALASPSAGDHTLSASYAAQGNFGAGSATGTLHVNPAATTASISAPTITYNANGSVTVSMTSTAGTVTGNVSLSVDGGTAASKALSSGSATFSNTDIPALTSPSPGDHTLSASYAAQGHFGASSATGTLHVNQSTATASISAPAVTYNANGLVTVTVSSSAGTPGGTVSLMVDGGAAQSQALDGTGKTVFTITAPS